MEDRTPACAFDALFDGGSSLPPLVPGVPRLPTVTAMDNNAMAEHVMEEEEEEAGVAGGRQQVYVRKFSTLKSKRVVEEPGVRRPSDASLLAHRVVILGSAEVGKTSLVNQLPSAPSSHVYAGLPRQEEACTVCEVELDGWRAQIEFRDPSSLLWLGLVHGDPQAAGQLEELEPSLLVVVYAVDDNLSLTHAARLLGCLKRAGKLEGRPPLLVANKADLVRNREVTDAQGRDLATRYQSSYLEVSSGLGYNLDQLLVCVCQEIQASTSGVKHVKKSSIKDKVLGLVSKKYSK